jgi:hypothetical protein
MSSVLIMGDKWVIHNYKLLHAFNIFHFFPKVLSRIYREHQNQPNLQSQTIMRKVKFQESKAILNKIISDHLPATPIFKTLKSMTKYNDFFRVSE